MKQNRPRRHGPILLAVAVGMLAACESPSALTDHSHADVTPAMTATPALPQQGSLLQDVKSATARFHSTVQATSAGYVESSPCVSAPGLGGMGFHWVNQGLVDPSFDPLNPEAVLYEPAANGQKKLVAVEYIVIDVGQPAPTFAGQAFDVGGTPVPVAHWSLHVWLHKENPAGIFIPFNPDVVCP